MKNSFSAKRFFCVQRDHWHRRSPDTPYWDNFRLAGFGARGHTDYRYWVHLHMGWR